MASKRVIVLIELLILILSIGFFLVRSNTLVSIYVKNSASENPSTVSFPVSEDVMNRSLYINEKYLILYTPDKDSDDVARTYSNLCELFNYTKKQYATINPQNLDNLQFKDYYAVIIVMHDLENIHNLNSLCDYADNGGKVFITCYFENNDGYRQIYRKLGITESGDYTNKDGIYLKDNVLFQAAGFSLEGNDIIRNFGLDISLDKNCIIHATSENKQPLLWENTYGKGKFVVFNGTCLAFKNMRGILLAGISYLSDYLIYPILNMKLMYIDDFPAPIPEGYNKTIQTEYGCDTKSFYKDIWWADITRLAQKYQLKLSCTAIETYNNNVKPPFSDLNKDMIANLRQFGYEVINSNGELGIHGYNHQSLAPANYIKQDLGYKPWANENDMEESINVMHSYMKSVFFNYKFQLYVPPSNILSSEGRDAIKQSMKDLYVISSVYNDSDTGDQFVQEFDVSEDGIVDIPRITSGYEYTDVNTWSELNALSSIGVFSHFIHPDDVLDTLRSSNLTWEDMFKQFQEFLDRTMGENLWLDAYTASQAANHIKGYLNTYIFIVNDNGLFSGYLTSNEKMSFIIRTKSNVQAVSSCSVIRIDDNVYLLKTNSNHFEFRMDGGNS
jgi:hypothetical protein